MKKINELRDYLLENYVDEYGDLNISGLDFSDFDGDIVVNGMKVKGNLIQNNHEVKGDLYQSEQDVEGTLYQGNHKVKGRLFQDEHEVGGDLYQSQHKVEGDLIQTNHEVNGDLIQNNHEVKGDLFQSWHKVKGDLFQAEHKVKGDLHQSYHEVDGNLYQDCHEVKGDLIQYEHDEDNQNKHMQVCERLNSIYVSKNKDYGNSFGEQYQEYGITSSVIRLDDKMRRLKQITKNGAKVEAETIEDTLLDLANYAILTLMELEGQDE